MPVHVHAHDSRILSLWLCLLMCVCGAQATAIAEPQVATDVLSAYVEEVDNLLRQANSDIEARAPGVADRVVASVARDPALLQAIQDLRAVYDRTPIKSSGGVNLDPGKQLLRGIKIALESRIAASTVSTGSGEANSESLRLERAARDNCELQLRDLQAQHTTSLRELIRLESELAAAGLELRTANEHLAAERQKQGAESDSARRLKESYEAQLSAMTSRHEASEKARIDAEKSLSAKSDECNVLRAKCDDSTSKNLELRGEIADEKASQVSRLTAAAVAAFGIGWLASWWLRVRPVVQALRALRRQVASVERVNAPVVD